jgi:hypothetical protein
VHGGKIKASKLGIQLQPRPTNMSEEQQSTSAGPESDDAEASATSAEAQSKPAGPGIRELTRQWKTQLEVCGTCCFNPLQKDAGIQVDGDNIRAECTVASKSCLRARDAWTPAPSSSGYGVKALPMIAAGRYQFEVELARKSALVIGWSVATSLPSGNGAHGNGGHIMGYKSNGTAVGGHSGAFAKPYGPAFGEAGDVIGALLDWTAQGPRVSFALNGSPLGVAFALASPQHAPLQPHIFQVPGPAFSVVLRGASADVPLRFPMKGYAPIGQLAEADFCPFSQAVERSSDSRVPLVARRFIHGCLGLQLPLCHVAQESLVKCGGKETDADSDGASSDCVIISPNAKSGGA